MATSLGQRFFGSTRGRIVTLLRRRGMTVDELAAEVSLTNNGVRAHLATLERDGLVTQRGSVRSSSGGGKPAYVYRLTPEAEALFPKAYEPVLGRLLDVLSGELGPEESEAMLREVGRRIAEGRTVSDGGGRARLEEAVATLNALGGLAELEEHDGGFLIRGYSCPLGAVAPDHPEVCRMAETLISELAAAPVREHCDREIEPRCCFEVMPSESADETP
jgi:predicted ArsR family transcriptional regulator